VGDVVRGGPGAAAGLKPGDVIVSFDGLDVQDSRTLRLHAGQTPPGKPVPLRLLRGGKTVEAKVTLEEIKDSAVAADLASKESVKALGGVMLEDLTAEHKAKLEIPGEVRGALVTAIERGSPAYESGLRPGDVLQEVDRLPVDSAHEAWKAMKRAPDSDVLLRVWEGGTSHYVVVKLHG
jgi:serine protease Do